MFVLLKSIISPDKSIINLEQNLYIVYVFLSSVTLRKYVYIITGQLLLSLEDFMAIVFLCFDSCFRFALHKSVWK